jgi:hypothetical protein
MRNDTCPGDDPRKVFLVWLRCPTVVAAAVEEGALACVVVLAGHRRIGVRLTSTVLTATSVQARSTVIAYSKRWP